MTPQALKASILQLAIQGKLVPQRPEEGTAEELYQQIQAEKQQLIANGTIKREKALAPIKEDEIPFDIPETWKWVRLGDCFDIATGKTPSKSEPQNYTPALVPFFKPTDILDGKHIVSCSEYVSEQGAQAAPIFTKGSVLVNCIGNIGRCAIVEREGICNQQINIIMKNECCNMRYILHVMLTDCVRLQEMALSTETTITLLNKNNFRTIFFPLPPLEEQKRIVDKIEEMLPLIDRYGEAYTELETFNKRFPDDLRKSILQEAIQGKLVPQLPEEGTAEELYQQIQAEKQRLIAAGTIKKEKPLPSIEEKDLPFDIPETWKWVRLGDCTNFGQTKQKTRATDISDDTWIADLEDIEKSSGRLLRRITSKERKIAGDKTIFKKGDILFSKLRPYLQKILIANESGVCTSELVPFSPYGDIDPQYLLFVLKSPSVDSYINTSTYGMKMPRVGRDTMLNILVPLPPLAEQKRIVAKIEEMLTLCKILH